MTMKQLQKSMDMMRDICSPKFNLTPGKNLVGYGKWWYQKWDILTELLQGIRKGVFVEDKELKVEI